MKPWLTPPFKETPAACMPNGVLSDPFKIQHLRIATKAREPEHQLHFCALKRSVETRDLTRQIANLRGPLADEGGGPFLYAGYISGDYLDKYVNQERTRLDLPHEHTL